MALKNRYFCLKKLYVDDVIMTSYCMLEILSPILIHASDDYLQNLWLTQPLYFVVLLQLNLFRSQYVNVYFLSIKNRRTFARRHVNSDVQQVIPEKCLGSGYFYICLAV